MDYLCFLCYHQLSLAELLVVEVASPEGLELIPPDALNSNDDDGNRLGDDGEREGMHSL